MVLANDLHTEEQITHVRQSGMLTLLDGKIQLIFFINLCRRQVMTVYFGNPLISFVNPSLLIFQEMVI